MKNFLIIISIIVLSVLNAKATDPYNKFTYQGVLTNSDGTVVSDGSYDFVFKVYDVSTGGTSLSTFTKSAISVSKGLFQVELGETGEFEGLDFITTPYYIEITVGATVLSPRIEINPVGKSIISRNLKNGAVTNADISGSNIQNTPIGTTTPSTGKFTSLESGTLKITGGTLAAGKVLTSDASGNATWQTSGGGLPSGIEILTNSTTAPSGFTYTGQKLEVVGSGGVNTLKSSSNTFDYGSCFYHNNKLYMIGGFINPNGSTQNIMFNVADSSLTTKTSMSVPRYYYAGAVYNNKIYIFGGLKNSSTDTASRTAEVYDINTNTWSNLPSMPNRRATFSACVLNTKIYLAGGKINNSSTTFIDSVYVFDPSNNTYSTVKKMNNARSVFGLAAYNGKLYALGGDGLSSIEEYDPNTNVWTTHVAGLAFTSQLYSTNVFGNLLFAWSTGQMYNLDDHSLTSIPNYDVLSQNPYYTATVSDGILMMGSSSVAKFTLPSYKYLHSKD